MHVWLKRTSPRRQDVALNRALCGPLLLDSRDCGGCAELVLTRNVGNRPTSRTGDDAVRVHRLRVALASHVGDEVTRLGARKACEISTDVYFGACHDV